VMDIEIPDAMKVFKRVVRGLVWHSQRFLTAEARRWRVKIIFCRKGRKNAWIKNHDVAFILRSSRFLRQ
jgi:hypothetical protein